MRKLVVLKLDGDLEQGVRVTLEIGAEEERPNTEIIGQLPPASDLVKAIDQWQSAYRSIEKSSRIKAKKIVYGGSLTEWRSDCENCATELRKQLNNWLVLESFRPIREKWLQQLSPSDEVRVLIRTSSVQLRKLPWHLWDLIEDYTLAEVAYCVPESEQSALSKTPTYRDKVRILAILGNTTGINVQKDRQLLENLPDAATTFLVEPQRQDISDSLWNQPWDILFFAGHSKSEGDTGRIYINQTDSLTITELSYALRNAVTNGLQVAIFNSCDGLGLALELEQLHIGQIIVMREPVPDEVAQAFLTDFLAAFATGRSFYLAQREARLKLQGLENNFPCASWLPVIFQNPAAVPPMWQDLGRRPTDVCPYRGLFAFREEDAPFFKGREAFTEILVEAVQKQPLVAVIGPSGSGKSSVVFAGLISRLRSEGKWRIISFRPGDRPLHSLAAALISQLEAQMSRTDRLREVRKLASDLHSEDNALRDVVEDIVWQDASTRLLLVADQFEELYTLCRDAQERQVFLDRLLEAANPSLKFALVLTLRADFLGQALSYRPLADALQQGNLMLGPMNREELQAAVEQPAALFSVTLEEGLTERILDAVSTQAGNLPLLEFALHQLWTKQRNTQLLHAAYNEIGGIEASVAGYAEQVYNNLKEPEKERARRIFLDLVSLGERTEDTRRLATRVEVGEENWDLVTALAGESARLVVTGLNLATGEETVEIVHEALIRHWSLLRKWVNDNRKYLIQKRKIEAAASEWQIKGKVKDYLLQGKALTNAKVFQKEQSENLRLSELAKEFIKASTWQRLSNRLNFFGFGLTIAVLVAVVSNLKQEEILFETSEKLLDVEHYFSSGTFEEQQLLQKIQERKEALETLVKAGKNLPKINLSGADLSDAYLVSAKLHGFNLSHAFLFNAKLLNADLSNANLSNANLSKADLSKANVSNAGLRKADLSNAYFTDANLRNTNLGGAYLSDAELLNTNLSNANLSDTDLSNANLSNANLLNADLNNADLRKAHLKNADLGGADLRNANLGRANLIDADLRNANLDRANLIDATLIGTDLRGAENLTLEQVKSAQLWEQAKYDEDFRAKLGLLPSPDK
ncbi:pentapeptide repeat-containing protein [Trichocoleus sp. FACHB-832]|uniref:nSTAND1 domain-containing NTPase n=1 Tax=Trichocoleus sp. FACHB-832 TaxID=2692875 RepID=UPI001681C30F|nr:pentapeptide repeat-containing protein [Trichocoleus sp. FACHB-832]MBD1905566.1 pentapeptide repeat-containing protein [Trichocoleus sp. FACHB-832]